MAADRTTIQVSVELWQWLNARKRPGESFDDVLRRELDVDVESAADDGTAGADGDETTEEGGNDAANGGEAPATDADPERTWYRCGYCGKVFEVPGALAAHAEENHSEATIHEGLDRDHDILVGDDGDAYYCPDCDVSFDEWDSFAEHGEREHGRENAG